MHYADKLAGGYNRWILGSPRIVMLILLSILGYFIYHAQFFKLDASADSLLLEADRDLQAFRELSARYAVKDFLFLAITPHDELFSKASLQTLRRLQDELSALPRVDSIVSILDIPLVQQQAGSLAALVSNARTLTDPDVNMARARAELVRSPIFSELIISADGYTTAMQINLKTDAEFDRLKSAKNQLLKKQQQQTLTAVEQQALPRILADYAKYKARFDAANHENIVAVRAISARYQDFARLSLGGVAMVADDMITFIKRDLLYFGIGLFVFLAIMLLIIFRRLRWVALPFISCLYAGLFMIGLLGFTGWQVTVISSNFIALMLIITMSMNVHLIVRYRQLQVDMLDLTQRALVLLTIRKMVWPCLYTMLTTIIAFCSLIVSGIKPVIDFGWMMMIGLGVAFATSFLLFPTILVCLQKKQESPSRQRDRQITHGLASIADKHGNGVIIAALLLVVFSLYGINRLEVENSFINYFKADSEIYQGLKSIDQKLGGSIPLDVLITFPAPEETIADDDFDAIFSATEEDVEVAWFTPEKLDLIKRVHDYLDSLPAVGKVLSLASIVRVGEEVNRGEFNAFELALVNKRMPEELKQTMINPYISIANNEARIATRVLDSLPDLRRNELLLKIKNDLQQKFQIPAENVQLSGLLVLYNNMLQSLFNSQIATLGAVMVGIALMLLALFRSVLVAVIGIVPNILAAGIILGLMGWLHIQLDMMTITIAAITVGIAVDNSIHYIYRFREEFSARRDYRETLYYCHANIGKAVFYTAAIIIAGFSILVLSNFIPTIYFGFLTAFAMLIALFAALTLLPRLLLICRPFT